MKLSRYIFFLLLISCLCSIGKVGAGSQKPRSLSDDDGRAIVQILFDTVLKGQSTTGETLISPRFNPSWIPNSQSTKFRQLRYEEEKSGAEYYEIDFEIHRDYVDVRFKKGNYCFKSGPSFRFRKEKGNWIAKETGAVESHVPGSSCPGCKVGSGRSYRFNRGVPPATPQQEPLKLEGMVNDVACVRRDGNYVWCTAKLDLEFSNTSPNAAIILQTIDDDTFWHGGTTLALTRHDSETGSYVFDQAHWQSIDTSPEYQSLARNLDQPAPPPKFTRTIEPGKGWVWNTSVGFSLRVENSCDTVVGSKIGVVIGWREIEQLQSSMWMRVSFEMWPFNVENFKPNLGKTLRKRWSKFGTLYLDFEQSDRHSHGIITSEPIELDLRRVKLN